MLFIDRLAKVTDNAVVQGAVLVNVIGIRGNEDCRNRISRTNEVSVELNPVIPGMWTSTIRQAVSLRRGDARNSAADGKASTV